MIKKEDMKKDLEDLCRLKDSFIEPLTTINFYLLYGDLSNYNLKNMAYKDMKKIIKYLNTFDNILYKYQK